MAKPSSGSLLEQVAAGLPNRGPRPLVEALPADVYAEVCEVRKAWRAGKLDSKRATKTAIGRLIAKHLAERGFTIGHEAVTRWLVAE